MGEYENVGWVSETIINMRTTNSAQTEGVQQKQLDVTKQQAKNDNIRLLINEISMSSAADFL